MYTKVYLCYWYIINSKISAHSIFWEISETNIMFSVRPSMTETTALGAAMAAGVAEGINVWTISDTTNITTDTFVPSILQKGMSYFPLIPQYYRML